MARHGDVPRALAEDFSFALAVVLTPAVIVLELRRLLKSEDWHGSATYQALKEAQPAEPEESECADCGGRGRVPSGAGRAILQFLADCAGRP